jgi:aryl-alcohol dehydrogenase-like predicted oxidoreductase
MAGRNNYDTFLKENSWRNTTTGTERFEHHADRIERAIGGGKWNSAGPVDDQQRLPRSAPLDLGINWIDTAAAYGLGHSEPIAVPFRA